MDAIYNLGVAYFEGTGVSKDAQRAVKLFQNAADKQYVDAFYNLGVCYRDGEGVPQDYQSAIRWFKAAAEYGEPDSQVSLAVMYAMGWGVSSDPVEGHKWANLAAAAGSEQAVELRKKLEGILSPAQIAEAQRRARNTFIKQRHDKTTLEDLAQ